MLALHNINRFFTGISLIRDGSEVEVSCELTEIGSKRTETVIGHNTGKYDGRLMVVSYTQEEAKEIVACCRPAHYQLFPKSYAGHMQDSLDCLSGRM